MYPLNHQFDMLEFSGFLITNQEYESSILVKNPISEIINLKTVLTFAALATRSTFNSGFKSTVPIARITKNKIRIRGLIRNPNQHLYKHPKNPDPQHKESLKNPESADFFLVDYHSCIILKKKFPSKILISIGWTGCIFLNKWDYTY